MDLSRSGAVKGRLPSFEKWRFNAPPFPGAGFRCVGSLIRKAELLAPGIGASRFKNREARVGKRRSVQGMRARAGTEGEVPLENSAVRPPAGGFWNSPLPSFKAARPARPEARGLYIRRATQVPARAAELQFLRIAEFHSKEPPSPKAEFKNHEGDRPQSEFAQGRRGTPAPGMPIPAAGIPELPSRMRNCGKWYVRFAVTERFCAGRKFPRSGSGNRELRIFRPRRVRPLLSSSE